jgi:hypothetical protein
MKMPENRPGGHEVVSWVTALAARRAGERGVRPPETIGMVNRLPWFERGFPTALPPHLLPVIVERLRGTPARLAERLAGEPQGLIVRPGET